ncbi:E3 ubiquitin- ligase RHA2B-like [Olea europaea subsp. europaea]|uniref:E3 ubiquitin- ligase RHA2B-like n=1 Tax=Olea europaea subsp. europaea TaxID=158383 RepID=A0A8S0QGL6_OLEEU|nr:E3 ubiquitin- ligase RHA2B-like [Olea europaea subsp. europaea]
MNYLLFQSFFQPCGIELLDYVDDPTIMRYENNFNAERGDLSVECAVCLCTFDEGDEVRELKCHHLYHRVCLDRWLGYGHKTCPLCRNNLKPRQRAAELHQAETFAEVAEPAEVGKRTEEDEDESKEPFFLFGLQLSDCDQTPSKNRQHRQRHEQEGFGVAKCQQPLQCRADCRDLAGGFVIEGIIVVRLAMMGTIDTRIPIFRVSIHGAMVLWVYWKVMDG